MYDDQNIFAKILRNEIPCKKVYEDDHALAFHDINPQAPIHVLVIPKGAYVSLPDFTAKASDAEIIGFWKAVHHVTDILEITGGIRAFTNIGAGGGQEVPHFHVHVFGGKRLGRMLP